MILLLGAFGVMFPFVWMLLTALKAPSEVMSMPAVIFPEVAQWSNFLEAFEAVPFFRYLWNSIFVASCVTLGEVCTAVLAAYAFVFLEFKGKKVMFSLFLLTMMIPSEILLIPNYMTLSRLGWINTYQALILPWCASAFSIFLLKQQFEGVSKSYYYSSKMDGCRDESFLLHILLPISKPTLISIVVLKFINCWNSYMWPLITTNTQSMRTLPVGLASFSTEAGVNYHTLMAFSVLAVTPAIVTYLFLQKHLVRGVSMSGLKG
jgi:multiple sugar transport system permease protein